MVTFKPLMPAFKGAVALLVAGYGLMTALMSGWLLWDTLIGGYDVAVIEFARSGYLLWLWSAPLALVVALTLRRRGLLLALTPALLTFTLYYAPFYLPKNIPPPLDAPQLTVMSYNLLALATDLERIEAVIRAQDADVIGLQELGEAAAAHLAAAFADDYPHQALHPHGAKGQGILSRYPITDDRYWRYEDLSRIPTNGDVRTHGHQRVQIELDGRALVIYNTHPWPPVAWLGGRHFALDPHADRDHQITIRRVLALAEAETLPTLMIGDFNMSDQMHEYRRIQQRFTDSHRAAGWGMGYTYPAGGSIPPIIRLDYIFHDDQWRALAAGTIYADHPSDHHPVWARLVLLTP